MKQALRKIDRALQFFGFSPITLVRNMLRLGFFFNDYRELKKQKGNNVLFPLGKMKPILKERFEAGGTMSGHYFHQDLYVARQIYLAEPNIHVDIGSRTDGFVAHVASFRKIELLDIREMNNDIPNVDFRKADLMQLPDDMIEYCDSISSLHVIEHFGLGRYNDPVDYFGYLKAINNICNILMPNGRFYFSTPIGPQRIEFNAHRVFSMNYLLEIFTDNFDIMEFSYVNDQGEFYENVELSDDEVKNNFNCTYGCGIFILTKKVKTSIG